MKHVLLFLISLVVILSISCSKSKDSGAKGTVVLQLSNAVSLLSNDVRTQGTCASGFTCLSPTKFEMKVLAAYAVEDIDPTTSNNVGQVGMIWLNPSCSEINNCKPSMVDYSDLSDPTAFNQLLNSQAQSIATGTYKYVRLEFCQSSADASNVRVTSNSVTKEFTYGGCGTTSVALASPIKLEEGQSLTIQVAYDLSDGEVYYAAGGSCPDANNFCIGGIELVPSLVQ